MIFRTIAALAALLITLPGQALAHIGDHVRGIESGFLHPFSGLDHLLAMVAVGLIAARLGGTTLWHLPVAFISAMVAGAAVAMIGMTVPLVEAAILASVIICGAALIIDANVPVTLAATGTAAFAFFHGLAHGVEGPAAAPLGYILGFIGGTAILHMAGIAAYRGAARYDVAAAAALRLTGTVIMGAGVGLAYVA
ncbi:HupE/UreJ family protein [Ensifer sp. NBAIM29]|nr:HupE/UreJ family protein [Ensifer sp. NBAIM29]